METDDWKQDAKDLGISLNKLLKCPKCKERTITKFFNGTTRDIDFECLKGDHCFTRQEFYKLNTREK